MCEVHRRSDRTFTQPFHTVTPGANHMMISGSATFRTILKVTKQIWVKYRDSASLLLSSPDLMMFSTEVKTFSFTFTVLITKLFPQ